MRLNYITRAEIACKCGCGQDTFDVELSDVLESTRAHFKQRMFKVSGNRCAEYNKRICGAKNSQHIKSKAADIQIDNVSPVKVYEYLNNKYPNQFGVGSYESFTHVDVRSLKARW